MKHNTERIWELEKEVCEAWQTVEHFELQAAYLAELCVKAQGRELTPEALVGVCKTARDMMRQDPGEGRGGTDSTPASPLG